MSIFDNAAKKIQAEIKIVEEKLLNGRFRTLEDARGYVERRQGLLAAVDILKEQAKIDADMEE